MVCLKSKVASDFPVGNFDSLMDNTKDVIDRAIEVHKIKQKWMIKQWDSGHIPFASQKLIHTKTKEVSPTLVDFNELVYIIGIIGLNEVVLHHTGCPYETTEGFHFAIKYMNHIKAYIHQRAAEEI